MTVQETICEMMQNYPTMYRSRVQALARLFDSYSTHWEDGCLIDTDRPSSPDRNPLPYPNTLANPTTDTEVDDALFERRENAKAQFVLDNAHLMSRDLYSSFESNYPIRFEGKRFEDFPENATKEWHDAAVELAHAILRHTYWPDSTYAPEEEERRRKDQAKSQDLCKKFLERFRVITPCPYERAARVKELHREALALGLNLTEADGGPPKTSVL